jgi:PEGA domain-containing protein
MPVTFPIEFACAVLGGACVVLAADSGLARAEPEVAAVASRARDPSASAAAARVPPSPTRAVETVDVSTIDRKGTVTIDGSVVGLGDFHGRLAVGKHVIGVTQPGYDPFEEPIELRAGEPAVLLVTMTPSVIVRPPAVPSDEMRGVYGGFRLHALFEPGGLNSSICSVPGVTHCSTSSPVGGGLFGTFGYIVDPIGFDVLFGVQADVTSVSATAAGQSATVVIPRIGGVFAARARLAWQNSAVRFTGEAGLGAALRTIGLIAGGVDTAKYFAPAITLEGAMHLRVGRTAALSLGMMFWGENAGRGQQLQVKPLTTAVVIVRSTQAFFLPFIGMEIGP